MSLSHNWGMNILSIIALLFLAYCLVIAFMTLIATRAELVAARKSRLETEAIGETGKN